MTFVKQSDYSSQGGVSALELLELRADALCYGVVADNCHAQELRGEYLFDDGFIHGNVLLIEDQPINTHVHCGEGQLQAGVGLFKEKSNWFVQWRGRRVPCQPLTQPAILREDLAGYGRLLDYARMHAPGVLFSAPVRQCIFGARGQGCQFCTFEMKRVQLIPEHVIAAGLSDIIGGSPRISSLAVGGGTPNVLDHGVHYYGSLIEAIKTRCPHIRASVEIVPPPNVNDIDSLKNHGLDAVIMSIEVWNDTIRGRVCPGKSYMNRDAYVRAWDRANRAFGAGQVASVLLVGLEPEDSTIEGIESLVRLGVIPTLIPFRPYASTPLADAPRTNPDVYLRCSHRCSELLHAAGLRASAQHGCTGCGGCSLEVIQEPLFWRS